MRAVAAAAGGSALGDESGEDDDVVVVIFLGSLVPRMGLVVGPPLFKLFEKTEDSSAVENDGMRDGMEFKGSSCSCSCSCSCTCSTWSDIRPTSSLSRLSTRATACTTECHISTPSSRAERSSSALVLCCSKLAWELSIDSLASCKVRRSGGNVHTLTSWRVFRSVVSPLRDRGRVARKRDLMSWSSMLRASLYELKRL